jgi:beta-glucosidase
MFQRGLKRGLEDGSVSMERIDDAVRRILRQKFRLGLFENPFPDPAFIPRIGAQDHRDKARQAVRESLVLLKNENKALPLQAANQKIVVVGEHADNAGLQSGGWTVHWQGMHESYKGATTILEGIRRYAEDTVVYDPYATGNHVDADVVVVVVGENPYAEAVGDVGDGAGFYRLTLRENHQDYINAYAGKGPAVVVVLISGRPLVTTEQLDLSDAFVAAWLPGSEGDGIAEVLFGAYDFKGKLPHSWPRSVEDYKGKYGPNFWDGSADPLYELGYGLTYKSSNP